MGVLEQIDGWRVPHAAACLISPAGVTAHGDVDRPFRLASIAKVLTAWAMLVAVEEGSIGLDDPAGQPGSTVRHLLSHAGGYPFAGATPLAAPGTRRIYSNTGIELAAQALEPRVGMAFEEYLAAAVLEPLGMNATHLSGSPAHGVVATAADLALFAEELRRPRLVTAATATMARTPQFPDLAGIVPGLGRFDPCPWGIGVEVRGDKRPHWTGTTNSAETFGHFGGSGTFLWMDPVRDLGLLVLTDKPFDEWGSTALRLWPQLSDAVIAEAGRV